MGANGGRWGCSLHLKQLEEDRGSRSSAVVVAPPPPHGATAKLAKAAQRRHARVGDRRGVVVVASCRERRALALGLGLSLLEKKTTKAPIRRIA
jgi:hypothetical protein